MTGVQTCALPISAVELLDALATPDSGVLDHATPTSSGGGRGHGTPASSGADRTALPGWWRHHQVAVIGLYAVAVIMAWDAKEVHQGWATFVFFLVAAVATVGGVFRGHLLFSNRANHGRFPAERARARPVTASTDALVSLALLSDALVAEIGRAHV